MEHAAVTATKERQMKFKNPWVLLIEGTITHVNSYCIDVRCEMPGYNMTQQVKLPADNFDPELRALLLVGTQVQAACRHGRNQAGMPVALVIAVKTQVGGGGGGGDEPNVDTETDDTETGLVGCFVAPAAQG